MTFLQDLRYALRSLRRSPTFVVTAVLILALGIGMTTAMFTVFDAIVLRTLPVDAPEELIALDAITDDGVEVALSVDHIDAVRRESRTLLRVAGFNHFGAMDVPLSEGDRPVAMKAAVVTANFFQVLGARATLGRLLRMEDRDATSGVAVISYRAWRGQFGGDPQVVGRRLTITPYQRSYTIVGVAPPGLDYPTGTDWWLPVGPGSNPGLGLDLVARLAPDASLESARAEFISLVRGLDRENPMAASPAGAEIRPFAHAVLGDARPVLSLITAAVALLLLIACVNVGNLLLLRASSRTHEITVRRTLGAGYGRIARMLIAESSLLGVLGGVLGLALANGLLSTLPTLVQERLPRIDLLDVSGRPVGVALGVTLSALLIFGILPALAAARGDVASSLRSDSRSGRETRGRRRVRQALVASQVALAVVMLAGAGLLVRSLERLQRIDLGYETGHLSVLYLSIPFAKYDSPEKFNSMIEQLNGRVRELPGITGVTPLGVPPFSGANVWQTRLILEGQTPASSSESPAVPVDRGGYEYFRTLGIPILRGRGFLESDRRGAPMVVVVSEALAQRTWPGQDPLGKRLRLTGPDTTAWRTVVGVAGDIRFRRLREPDPTLFVPWQQLSTQGYVAVRTVADLGSVLPAIRQTVQAFDPDIFVWDASTMDDYLAGPLGQPRLTAVLISGFGVVALMMAAIGLFGVLASSVRERTRDLGIRMALGATRERLRRDVLAAALSVTAVGLVVGLVAALAGSRVLVSLLFEVSPADPATFVGVSVLLLVVALLAAYLAARRATTINPIEALRAD